MDSAKDILTIDMYYKAIEGSDSGLWVCDIKEGICYLSNRYYSMLGYRPDEFPGTMSNLFALLHPEDVETSNKLFSELFSGATNTYRNEVRLKTKSGEYIPILTQGLAERNAEGEVIKFIGWNIDISSLKDAQKKLDEERALNISQSRLAQLGLLAGGITHEVNNPLTVIQGRSEMILKSLQSDTPINKASLLNGIEQIQKSAKRIAEIIKGLRTIVDGGVEGEKTKVSLNHVVEEVLSICQGEVESRGIEIEVKLSLDRPCIMANFALLYQVFLNLINNASDALETKKHKNIWIEVGSDDKEAYFKIDDNGIGIKQEDQDKIMLPFFTTKDPGKGTGLGLSISKAIVKSQNGNINFETIKGLSRFTVKFPLAK
jgi:PAS domain S-box-containing protein